MQLELSLHLHSKVLNFVDMLWVDLDWGGERGEQAEIETGEKKKWKDWRIWEKCETSREKERWGWEVARPMCVPRLQLKVSDLVLWNLRVRLQNQRVRARTACWRCDKRQRCGRWKEVGTPLCLRKEEVWKDVCMCGKRWIWEKKAGDEKNRTKVGMLGR